MSAKDNDIEKIVVGRYLFLKHIPTSLWVGIEFKNFDTPMTTAMNHLDSVVSRERIINCEYDENLYQAFKERLIRELRVESGLSNRLEDDTSCKPIKITYEEAVKREQEWERGES